MTSTSFKKSRKKRSIVNVSNEYFKKKRRNLKSKSVKLSPSSNLNCRCPVVVNGEAVALRLRHHNVSHVRSNVSQKVDDLVKKVLSNTKSQTENQRRNRNATALPGTIKTEITESSQPKAQGTFPDGLTSRPQKRRQSTKCAVKKRTKPVVNEYDQNSSSENVAPPVEASQVSSRSEDDVLSSPITKRLRSRQNLNLPPQDASVQVIEATVTAAVKKNPQPVKVMLSKMQKISGSSLENETLNLSVSQRLRKRPSALTNPKPHYETIVIGTSGSPLTFLPKIPLHRRLRKQPDISSSLVSMETVASDYRVNKPKPCQSPEKNSNSILEGKNSFSPSTKRLQNRKQYTASIKGNQIVTSVTTESVVPVVVPCNQKTRPAKTLLSPSATVNVKHRLDVARLASNSSIPGLSTDPISNQFFDDERVNDELIASTSAEWYQSIGQRPNATQPSKTLPKDTRLSLWKHAVNNQKFCSNNLSHKTLRLNVSNEVAKSNVTMASANKAQPTRLKNLRHVVPFKDICTIDDIKLVSVFKKQFDFTVTTCRKTSKQLQRVFTWPNQWNSPLLSSTETKVRRSELCKSELCPLCSTDLKHHQFLQCFSCRMKFHHECLGYYQHPERDDWLCSDCIRCAACDGYIADCGNVQCDLCLNAYHGDCKPEGSPPSIPPFDHWICVECATRVEVLINIGNQNTAKQQSDKHEHVNLAQTAIKVPGSENVIKPDTINELLKPRLLMLNEDSNQSWNVFNDEQACRWTQLCDFSNLFLLFQETDIKETPKTTNKTPTSLKTKRCNPKFVKKSFTSNANQQEKANLFPPIEKNFVKQYRQAFLQEMFRDSPADNDYYKAAKVGTSIQSFYKKCYDHVLTQLPFNQKISCYIWFNLDVIAPVLAKEHRPWGNYSPLMLICQKCYLIFDSIDKLQIHMNVCPHYHPPGKEVYRDEVPAPHGEKRILSLFEVIGPENNRYGENLCRLASFFITSKTAIDESYNFHYFILTEFDVRLGFVPVGYFSKALRPEFNDNLSCILVFPQYRGRGYGKFLIDVSYEMSIRDRKWGSPEEPLSEDGLQLYRSYWRGIIYEHFRKHRFDNGISLLELCSKTHIHMNDLTKMLLSENMVVFDKDDHPYFVCGRAWHSSLRMIRRLKFDPTLLWWKPHFDPTAPDHRDYYQYVSSDDDNKSYHSTTISTISEDDDSEAEYYKKVDSIIAKDYVGDNFIENDGEENNGKVESSIAENGETNHFTDDKGEEISMTKPALKRR